MGSPAQRTAAEIRRLKAALDDRGLFSPLVALCREYHVTLDDVLQRNRTLRINRARDACIVRLLSIPMSLTEVGTLMGMHHTSVQHARVRYRRCQGESTSA